MIEMAASGAGGPTPCRRGADRRRLRTPVPRRVRRSMTGTARPAREAPHPSGPRAAGSASRARCVPLPRAAGASPTPAWRPRPAARRPRPSAPSSRPPEHRRRRCTLPSTTCALVPDHPNPLTPAVGGWSSWSGQGVGSAVTRNGSRSQSISGFGVRKCRCLGMTPCFIARMVLMTPATPAADSRCPMFVFTEPISRGRSGSRPWPYAAAVASSSMGSPTGVPVPWASR